MRRPAASSWSLALGLGPPPGPEAGRGSGDRVGAGQTRPLLDSLEPLNSARSAAAGRARRQARRRQALRRTYAWTTYAARLPAAAVNVMGRSAPRTQNRIICIRSRECLTVDPALRVGDLAANIFRLSRRG